MIEINFLNQIYTKMNQDKLEKYFEPLFSLSSNGKQKQWDISVDSNGVITTRFGIVGGKIQTNFTSVQGKNIGKRNETTPYEQALFNAQSLWNKKIDAGYNSSNCIASNHILPMLALNYTTRSHDIHFPCYVQPKIDGVRCIYHHGSLFSRNGKQFPHLDHILHELKDLDNFILDGELYSYSLSFQECVGLVKKEKLTMDDQNNIQHIKLIVFDCIIPYDFSHRIQTLSNLFDLNNNFVELIETKLCNSETSLFESLGMYESLGYEGLIIRNSNGKYIQNYRSKDLQKLKTFQDLEFEIVNFRQGKGLDKGCVVWECKTVDDRLFRVRPLGTREYRKELFINGTQYIGKQLTVKYQNLTIDGIPRFPVGITIRDYEN